MVVDCDVVALDVWELVAVADCVEVPVEVTDVLAVEDSDTVAEVDCEVVLQCRQYRGTREIHQQHTFLSNTHSSQQATYNRLKSKNGKTRRP